MPDFDAIEELRKRLRQIKRVVICHADLAEPLREAIEAEGLSGIYRVAVAPAAPSGFVYIAPDCVTHVD